MYLMVATLVFTFFTVMMITVRPVACSTSPLPSDPTSRLRTQVVPWPCPRGRCRCDEVIMGVDCSRHGLDATLPDGIPSDVESLYLRSNGIKVLKSSEFSEFTRLKILDLQNNSISEIEPNAFRNLYQLEILNLYRNDLGVIRSYTFHHLVNLIKLRLDKSNITKLPSDVFKLLPNLAEVTLGSNRILCDCHELRLQKWINERRSMGIQALTLTNATCQNFDNRPLLELVVSHGEKCPELQPLSCLTCDGGGNVEDCEQRGATRECSTGQDACHVDLRISTTNGSSMTSQCGTSSGCAALMSKNDVTCASKTCSLCCTSEECVVPTLLDGYHIDVTYDLRVILHTSYDDNLDDSNSTTFHDTARDLEKQIDETMAGIDIALCRSKIYGFERSPSSSIVMWTLVQTHVVCQSDFGTNVARLRDEIYDVIQKHADVLRIDEEKVTLVGEGFCAGFRNEKRFIKLSSTLVGQVSVIECLADSRQNMAVACVQDAGGKPRWINSDVTSCSYPSERTQDLEDLAKQPVTNDTVNDIAEKLADLTRGGADFTSHEVSLVADVIGNIVNTDDVPVPEVAGSRVLESINRMLNVSLLVMVETEANDASATRLIESMERLGNALVPESSQVTMVETRVAMAVVQPITAGPLSFEAVGDLHDDLDESRIHLRGIDSVTDSNSDVVASITLPGSVVQTAVNRGRDRQLVQFVIYSKFVFFKAAESVSNTSRYETRSTDDEAEQDLGTINSHVISAAVGRKHLFNLTDPITVTLTHTKPGTSARCVFWDSVRAGWSTQGCWLLHTDRGRSICQCDHLTNFALLMDVYGNAGSIDEGHQLALSYISYIGCGLSGFGLLCTLITYLGFRKLRTENPAKILVNLTAALLGVIIAFVLTTQGFVRGNHIACKIFAAATHYCLLAAMVWMSLEAFYMYQALVRVFQTYYTKFMLKCVLVGWGSPLVIVLSTLAVNTSNYGLQGEICWLSRTPFFVTFLAPVTIILVLNLVTFGLVSNQLRIMDSKKLDRSRRVTMLSRLRGAVSIMVLLGLTWGFAFFAIGGAGIVFHYLFAIFNTLQGLFIFVFYCLLKKETQIMWMHYLGCDLLRDESSTTSRGYFRPPVALGNTGRSQTQSSLLHQKVALGSIIKPQKQGATEPSLPLSPAVIPSQTV